MPSSSKKHVESHHKIEFRSLTVQANHVETVIKLLYSPELPVVNDAIIALNRYAISSPQSLIDLYHSGIISPLLYLINHPDQEVLRFTLKLISSLIQINDVVEEVKLNQDLISRLTEFLQISNDEILHEYSTFILAKLSKNRETASILTSVVDAVWKHIYNRVDLDTVNASLIIMKNLLEVNETVNQLFGNTLFGFEPIIAYFMSEYVELQRNSLNLFHKILACGDNQDIHERLVKAPEAFQEIFNVIERPLYSDKHILCLKSLREMLVTEPTITLFIQKQMLPKLLEFAENVKTTDEAIICADIVTQIAQIPNWRHELYLLCVDKFLLKLMNTSEDERVILKACQGINAMVRHPKAVKCFINEATLKQFVQYMYTKEGECWLPDRCYVIEILSYLLWSDPQVVEFLTLPALFKHFLKTLEKNFNIIPVEYFKRFLHLFEPFVLCEKWYTCIVKTNLLNLFSAQIDNDSDIIKTTVLEIMGSFLRDGTQVDWCLKSGTYLAPAKYLTSKNFKLCTAAACFINQIASYEKIALLYVEQDILDMFLEREKDFEQFSIWKQAIKKMYDAHLAKKFNVMGYLEMLDVTRDGFYILKRPSRCIPKLCDLQNQIASPMEMIYTVNFECKTLPMDKLKEILEDYELENFILETIQPLGVQLQRVYQPCQFHAQLGSVRSLTDSGSPSHSTHQIAQKRKTKSSSSLSKLSESTPVIYQRYKPLPEYARIRAREAGEERDSIRINELPELPTDTIISEVAPRLMSWIGLLPPDPYLMKYLNEINKTFQHIASDETPNFRKLIYRIEFLAEYVAKQMSGPTDLYLTPEAQQEHLNQLKWKYGSNLIPIGFVRIGSFLERALLYKILADRLEIPCTFKRGCKGRAWNEVPLVGEVVDPEYNRSSFEGPIIFYVVDLMNFPGQLYPVNTSYAADYCTDPN